MRDWPGYSAQKNHAAELAAHDWILSLDADERVTPELGAEIRSLLEREPAARGYRMPRVTLLPRAVDSHRPTGIRTTSSVSTIAAPAGGTAAACTSRSSCTDGARAGQLRHELHHFAYRDISHHLATIDRYTTLAAEQWLAEGRRTNAFEAVSHARLAFFRNYLLRGGIRDGGAGLLVSALNSYYVFLKLAKLWELQHVPPPRQPSPDPGLRARQPAILH